MAQATLRGTPLIYPLGLEGASTTLADLGSVWDVSINSKGYLISTLDQESPFEYRAITIEPAQLLRPRIDTSPEPGEQTLEEWWARAQHSWHRGAGQDVFDSEDSIRTRFKASKGVDPWTDGQITLLKTTTSIDTSSDDYQVLTDAGYLILADNGVVHKFNDLDGSSDSHDVGGPGAGSTTVQDMTSDGTDLYVCFDPTDNAGIRKVPIADAWPGATDTLVNDLDPDLIEFAKNRLMAAKDNKLYQISDLTVTTAPTEFFTHIYSAWVWTAITGAAAGIYCSGYAGERSEIYHIGLDSSTLGSGSTLNAPRSVWEAPEGEVIHTIRGYLGTSLLVGTSRGVRVGNISETGDVTVTPLIVETPSAVKCFEPSGDYAYFGWTNFDATSSGIGRIHLGRLDYASDLMYDIQATINSIAEYGGRKIFTTRDAVTNRVIVEHATDYVASGYFETGEIRFGTFEEKTIQYFDSLTTGAGTMDVEIAPNLGSYVQVLFDQAVGQNNQRVSSLSSRFRMRLTLKRATATTVPALLEWRLRADPLLPSRLIYSVPLMIYDRMTTRNGSTVGYPGYANEKREELFNLFRDQVPFFFQFPNGQLIRGRMDNIQFKSYTPPQGMSGMGGILLVFLKEEE